MAPSARKKRERLRNSNLTPLSHLSLRGVLLEPRPASPLISTRNLVPALSSSVVKLDRLGKGATSNVFQAVHAATLKMVALKEVSVSTEADRRAVRTEMRALVTQRSPLLHSTFTTELAACPRIVEYYGSVVTENGARIAVEYVAGGSLGSWLDSGCHCPEAWIAHIAYQALEALDFLHKRGRVHRDVKPANLLITRNGDLKLADFGAAGVEYSSRMVGTQRFMAPERLQGRPATAQSDLWSLGLTLATAALGENPIRKASCEFEQTEFACLAEKTIRKQTSLSPLLTDFLCKCLAPDRTRRPPLKELMQHEFLEQRHGWEENCPEVATAMRDRKKQQREDGNALSTEAVLDFLCQARAQDNIMGARSRVDTSTAADLAYELGVSPKSLVKRVRQRTQQLILRNRGTSACACGGHGGDTPPGGGGFGDGYRVALTTTCCDLSTSGSGSTDSCGSRFICIGGDGHDLSPSASSSLCGLSPMASPPFMGIPSIQNESSERYAFQYVKDQTAMLLHAAAGPAPVSTVRPSIPLVHPPMFPVLPKTVTETGMMTSAAEAVIAAQTPMTAVGTPALAVADSAQVPSAAVLPEPSRTPRMKPVELSSSVRLTPHKRRGEKERRSSRTKGNRTPGQESRRRQSRARRHRRARERESAGRANTCIDDEPNDRGPATAPGLVCELATDCADEGAVGCRGNSLAGRKNASRRQAEVPRTAASRILPSRSKLLQTSRSVFTLADKMKEELKVKDRIHGLRVYKKCFSGREAVQWMLREGHASSVADAARLGNEMMTTGVFEHISNSHIFEDSSVLYRFSDGQKLPPPASGGRRIGQIARVVMKKIVNGVVGAKGGDDFEEQISGFVSKASSSISENDGGRSRSSSHRTTSGRSSPNKDEVKKAAGSDFSTAAPSATSGGPSPKAQSSTAIDVSVDNKPATALVVAGPSCAPRKPPRAKAKPPRVPVVDRKNASCRGDRPPPRPSGSLRRFNSSVSATTMPETPTSSCHG